MNPNTHSIRPSDGLAALTMAVQQLATQDLHGLPDAVRRVSTFLRQIPSGITVS